MLDRPLTCPNCGHKSPIINMVEDASARAVLADLLKGLPYQLHMPMMGYLGLFKPKQQNIRWSVMHARMQTILPQIKSGRVERKGNAAWCSSGPLDRVHGSNWSTTHRRASSCRYAATATCWRWYSTRLSRLPPEKRKPVFRKARHRARDTQDEDQSFRSLADIALGKTPGQPERGSESDKQEDEKEDD